MNFGRGGKDALTTVLRPLGINVSDTDSSDCSSDTSLDSSSSSSLDDAPLQPILSSLYASVMDPVRTSVVGEKRVPDRRSPRSGWKKRTKLPYTSSMFYRDYHNANVRVTDHIDAKEFRLNYRMPWSEVHKLVHLFVQRGWVKCKSRNGTRMCPPEVKILGTLYWLGEGCSIRTIYNLSGRVLTAVSFNLFAKMFCARVANKLGPLYIKTPSNVRELQRVEATYATLGFPGACGSTDGVQIAWEGCPFALRRSAIGKEKYPTLGFNVTVDHECRILYICSVFMGRFNDKTKIQYDEYCQKLRSGTFAGFEYSVLDEDGQPTRCTTPYLICDNGYHRWTQLMCPYKTTSNEALALWSKHLESTRKDVERTFGCMKKRFKILKIPLLFRDVAFINDIFVTCAVLHNKLLTHDAQFDLTGGRFRYRVSRGIPISQRRRILLNNVNRLLNASDDYSYVGRELVEDLIVQVDSGFEKKRKQLAKHIHYLFVHQLLKFGGRK